MRSESSTATSPTLLERLKVHPDDEAAWRRFDERYRILLFRFARQQGLPEADAQDLAQETMIVLARQLRTFEYDPARCRFRTWLYRIAVRRVIDWRRRQKRAEALKVVEVGNGADPISTSEAEAIWDREWNRSLVEAAIRQLQACRKLDNSAAQVLHEVHARGRDCQEAAKVLGRKPQDVYRIKSRWIRPLRAAVEELRAHDGERW